MASPPPLVGRTSTPAQKQDLALLQQTPQQDWQRQRIPILSGGVRMDLPATELQPNESPFISNLALISNHLRVDTGYIPFGHIPYVGGFAGTVQVPYQIYNPDGTTSVLLVTTATVYVLQVATMEWQLLPFEAFFTSTTVVASGATTITLTSGTGIVAGDHMGLPLDNQQQLIVTVQSVAGAVVTFTPAVPAGRTVPASSSNVAHGVNLHGSLLHQVSIQSYPGKSWIFISNAIDPVMYYDTFGGLLHNLVTHSDLPVNTTCAAMAVFHGSLFLFATEENGQDLPQRVRMSDIGNPLSWTPAANGGPLSSIAAIYDLLDTEDFLHAATILGPYLVLYRETTIMRGTYLGVLTNIIFWEYTIYSEGITSIGAVSEIGSQHQFVGNGGIYQYDASYQLNEVGDPIYTATFSAVGDLNASQKDTIFSQYCGDYDEFWVFYPHNQALYPDKMIRQALDKLSWYYRFFANTFVGSGPYLPTVSTTWSTAIGTWASQTATWDSRIFLANVASIMLAANDVNQVFLYDYRATTDNGAVIPWSLVTKDIQEGGNLYRWDSCHVYGSGNGVLVEVSIDGGQSFSTVGTLNFGVGLSVQQLTFQFVSHYIRFRLSGNDPKFEFVWLDVWFQLESEY